jgi:hypothetical protein
MVFDNAGPEKVLGNNSLCILFIGKLIYRTIYSEIIVLFATPLLIGKLASFVYVLIYWVLPLCTYWDALLTWVLPYWVLPYIGCLLRLFMLLYLLGTAIMYLLGHSTYLGTAILATWVLTSQVSLCSYSFIHDGVCLAPICCRE